MSEREDEFNLDDVFAGIDGILNDAKKPEPVEPKLDKDEHLDRYSRYFIHLIIPTVSNRTEPNGLAPRVKREFDQYKRQQLEHLNKNGEIDLVEIIDALCLDDVVKAAGSYIYESEREIADFESGSFDYKRQEDQIRRLEIIQRASDEAKNL